MRTGEKRCRPAGTFASWTGIVTPVSHIAVATPLLAVAGVPSGRVES